MNFKFLNYYVDKKGYLFCEFKVFGVIFIVLNIFCIKIQKLNLFDDIDCFIFLVLKKWFFSFLELGYIFMNLMRIVDFFFRKKYIYK